MKQLTYSSMAAARLRANKRQYLSLVLGIFLSIFLISTLVLIVYGIYQAELQKRYDKVGYLDMVILDNPTVTEDDVRSFDEFDRFGHAYISGIVTDSNLYIGYYDEVGLSLVNLKPIEGRLPEAAGEIAIEASAMDVLEASWSIGETVELDITPVDGTAEKRSFTLVGVLPERSVHLSVSGNDGLNQFPAVLTSAQEPAFAVGRLGTHYLMGLSEHTALDQAILAIWDKAENSNWNVLSYYYGLSITGERQQVAGIQSMVEKNREMFSLITIAGVLGASLILSCGVGISGAMEGMLSKRREEIGVLRALGATRSQIRRMFGRENLILACIVSPLAILASIGAVWVLSLLLPGSIKYAFHFWLVIPIALFSIVVILISGHLPLAAASKLMPMSVIRDTAMLRRSKSMKSKKEFSAPQLIASRQVRFNPTRQIGASLLVGLMLLCSGLLTAFIGSYLSVALRDIPGFELGNSVRWSQEGFIGIQTGTSLSKQSIAQIRSLPNVKSLKLTRYMNVTMILDHAPRYAMIELGGTQFGMLDDTQFEEAISIGGDRDFWEQNRKAQREAYLQFLDDYQIPGEAFSTTITTLELNSENLERLRPLIASGQIHVDAINAGKEVIVVAPEIWIAPTGNGGFRYWFSEEEAKSHKYGEGAFLAAWNDSFSAGQRIPLLQLFRNEGENEVFRSDTEVTVGAVLSGTSGFYSGSASNFCVITTEQGLEKMGLYLGGLNTVQIYLDGDISLEQEETLERQLNAIGRRDGYTLYNNLKDWRALEADHQQRILLFAAISIVFFSVSVGMIVSSVTRQLHSEGRTIGMLRAVGADEKAILGCYSGQINAGVAGGLWISLGLLAIFLLLYWIESLIHGYQIYSEERFLFLLIGATVCVTGILCLFVCKFLLRFRVREIINKSIIDNIREL